MKLTIFVCVIFVFSCSAQSLESRVDDTTCVSNSKCCEFREVHGTVTCVRKCEPQVNCESLTTRTLPDLEAADNSFQAEVIEEQIIQTAAAFSLSMNAGHICRKGFRLDSYGKCRRVLGTTIDKTNEQQQE